MNQIKTRTGESQRERIVFRLRELIMTGALAPGERVPEIPLADRLGVSRTPVRYALGILAREGLVVAAGRRGFVVRSFSMKDIMDAIELRGTLEGMAARLVAERGVSADLAAALEGCLEEGRDILSAGTLDEDAGLRWSEMNERFHRILVESSENGALANAVALNDQLPFASAKSFFGDMREAGSSLRHYAILRRAQEDHVALVEAITRGQGARAEGLMREHSLAAANNIRLFGTALPALGGGG